MKHANEEPPHKDGNPPAEATPRKRIVEIFKEKSDVRFTRQDQLTMTGMGHGFILVGVTVILWRGFSAWPSGIHLLLFYITEGVILVFGLASIVSARQILNVIDKWFSITRAGRAERWMNGHPTFKEGTQGAILIGLFLLQFGSLAMLLVATEGPIESPFAPMALGIGVFTPFIVNSGRTIASTILATMAFYVVMIAFVGPDGNSSTPLPGSYAAVNLFILLLASFMTFARGDSSSFTVTKILEADQDSVWNAWTDAAEVAKWLQGADDGEPSVAIDLLESKSWRISLTDQAGRQKASWFGRILQADMPEKLTFTIDDRSGLGCEVVRVEIKARGERTTQLVVSQSDGGRLDGLKSGWEKLLSRMHGVLLSDRKTASRPDPA